MMEEGRNLLAKETEGRNLLSEYKPAKSKEPTFSEKAGAVAYGLGTSTLGALGDIESFVVPEQIKAGGFAEKTYLPSTKDIQKAYEKIGIPKPREEVSGYQKAGELAPAVGAGGKILLDVGKAGISKLRGFMGGGKQLAEQLKTTTAGRVSEEAQRAAKKAQTEEQFASAAEQIAQREAGKPSAAYAQMPGVKMGTEAGVTKPIPQTMDEIGNVIKNKADEVFDNLKNVRERNASVLKKDAFGFALEKEKKGLKVADTQAYQKALKSIDAAINNPDTKLTNASIDAIKNQLTQVKNAINPRQVDPATGIAIGKPVSFQGLENLRRFLGDRARGLPAEGFDAIGQQQAGRLEKLVDEIMIEFSEGKIKRFINQYRKDSEPMRVFQTKVGKALVNEQLAGKGVNYAKVPAQSIPNQAFASPENYKALVDAFGGNKTYTKLLGQRYFASQLEGIKDAQGIEKFIRDNRTMLKETDFLKSAEKYAMDVRKAETRGAKATKMGEARTASAAEQRKLQEDLNVIGSDVARARNISEINAQTKNAVDRLYDAGRMTLKQRDQVLNNINKIKDLEEKRAAAMTFIKIALPSGVGGTVAYEYFIK
jgi:hypothetical protein